MVITLIQPKLGLRKKTDADLQTYANNIITDLDLNIAAFPGIDLAGLKLKRDKYTSDLSKVMHGTPSQTSAKNSSRLALENILKSISNDCAEIADGNEEVFFLSGFEIKAKPSPSGQLQAPEKFDLTPTPVDGTLLAKFKSVKNANAYEIFFGVYGTDPATWELLSVTTAGKFMINDLQSNVKYSARVRAVGTKGKKGLWTEIVTRKTY